MAEMTKPAYPDRPPDGYAQPGALVAKDVTAEFTADLNDHDTMYRSGDGHLVKIKTLEIPTNMPSLIYFRMTASLCEDTGKAKDHEDGPLGKFIVEHHDVPCYSHRRVDIEREIRVGHEWLCQVIDTTVAHRAQIETLRAMPAKEFKARGLRPVASPVGFAAAVTVQRGARAFDPRLQPVTEPAPEPVLADFDKDGQLIQ